ncbi:glutamate--tRNA ligase [Candidatus Saccharibacteria bacterium]|nr:glutamate--tRNA ligase [Candidatus Saccharibacteria bacterium]
MSNIRTRFAPSPTGLIHVGGIRTALYAWLVARGQGGQFVLRLEDTDQKREVAGADQHIIDSLRALGLDYDEGPDIGGSFAPYRQSERLDHYRAWAEKLIAAGRAYADPYSPEEIEQFRDAAKRDKKPFLYRNHRPEDPPVWDGQTALRFKSDAKDYHWHDAVMGDLSAGAEAIDDFILIKSDGFPTYNFAHIVDDAEMQITHVIRGQEFIASMPNYLNLYEALGIERPIFATLPHILNEQGNKKLSKRDGARDILDYFRAGFLREALVNFIASMGWNDGTEQEIFSVDELIAKFSLDRVGRSGARFDEKRLLWMNGQWIKRLDLDDLYARTLSKNVIASAAKQSRKSNDELDRHVANAPRDDKMSNFWGENGRKASEAEQKKVLAIVQDRLKTLADLPALSEYFFARPTPDWSMIDEHKQLGKLGRDEQIDLLGIASSVLAKIDEADWNEENLQSELNNLLSATNSKPPILFGLIRFALTWAPFSPGLSETMVLLGREETLARLLLSLER